MCGIYGILNFDKSDPPDEQLLARMGAVIVHRGPDDAGHYFGHGVGLGMRRLSIIDVSGGHQPLSNEDGTVWVVLNGELYNFQPLRAELEKKGHKFRTRTDTEVVVHLYEEEGVGLFKRLRGMFGLAVWDTKRRRLLLGRDRIGEKPLYIRREPGRLLFASELKSILQATDAPRQINPLALQEYLSLGYVPAPLCLLDGMEKLLPGHYLTVENGKFEEHSFWDVPEHEPETRSEEEWCELVREKILETVRSQLVSDVPLGAFLSGGLDSSTIIAAMSRLTNQPVKTYSIGYEGEHSYYNELPYARLVAKAFGTDHHEIVVRPDVGELLPQLIWHLDEPIADSACLTTYLVSKLARKSVTVILSGVGGDELFGGYRRYLGNSLHSYYRKLPHLLREKAFPALLRRVPQDRHTSWKDYARYAAAFVRTAQLDSAARYASYVTLFPSHVEGDLLERSWGPSTQSGSATLRSYFERRLSGDELSRIFYADLKTSLTDDLLAMTDRMSMAASIECRSPLVDFEFVESINCIPSNLKVRGMQLKYILKKAVRPWLPREILERKKRGFGAPIGAWLRKELQPLVNELLSETTVRRRGLLRWSAVQELRRAHDQERSDYTDGLFALIQLELWCRTYLDANPAADAAPLAEQKVAP